MANNIFDFWSFTDTPREVQTIALYWLEQNIVKNTSKKYFFIEAGVGSGKSNMAITIGQYLNKLYKLNSCILTPQKVLQRQYETTGHIENLPLASMYGRKNYSCHKGTNCEIGAGFGKKCANCPYDKAREKALNRALAVMNYDLYLSMREYSEHFQDVQFSSIICDEAHRLESFLTEFNALEWTKDKCYYYEIDYDICRNFGEVHTYLKKTAIPLLEEYLEFMEREYPFINNDKSDLTTADSKVLEKYALGMEDIKRMKDLIHYNADDFNFNCCIVTTENGWKIKQLFGASNFIKYMEPFAKKFIFLSGTMPDVESTAIEMGLDLDQVEILKLPSTFHKSIRPFVYMPVGRVNANWNNDEALKQKMLYNVMQILAKHSNQNGIIHTANYQMAKWLVEELDGVVQHEIYHHNDGDRDGVIESFIVNTHENKVLISPSCTEGLDLKNDLGSFAIFTKIPFPYLGDEWIKKRTQISNEWYEKQAVINIVQGTGRIVRHIDDFGITYMLDENYTMLSNNAGWMFPDYWKEAVMKVKCFSEN